MRAPPASSSAVRERMRATRGRDTGLELRVRAALRALGRTGYRVDRRPEPGVNRRADVVFARARVAVFLDGCFWHGCPAHSKPPGANPGYWGPKLAANRARDAGTTMALRAAGWVVLRFWEHEPAEGVAARIDRIVASRDANHATRTRP